jgi:hypothetical protein
MTQVREGLANPTFEAREMTLDRKGARDAVHADDEIVGELKHLQSPLISAHPLGLLTDH